MVLKVVEQKCWSVIYINWLLLLTTHIIDVYYAFNLSGGNLRLTYQFIEVSFNRARTPFKVKNGRFLSSAKSLQVLFALYVLPPGSSMG
jgi:hypothetical protein